MPIHKATEGPGAKRAHLYKKVGARFRFYREAKKETLKETAAALGCGLTLLHKIETGETPVPLYILVSGATYFGVTANDLVRLDE